MDPLLIAAAGGLKARMDSLDMLANNVANAGTAGFKTDREFYSLYASEEARLAAEQGSSPELSQLPVVERQWTDLSQGTLVSTSSPLNLALDGRGFFSLNGPSGKLLTRNGTFRLSKSGQIETQDGYTLRNRLDGKPIQVDPDQPVEVSPDGTVHQQGQEIGQIEILDPNQPGALAKLGNTYFMLADPRVTLAAADAQVRQGNLEQANVPVAEAAVRLVSVLRQFEMLQRAMTLGAEMNRQAMEEVARVSP
jgi:flagellar basal-body rod protein FlgF